MLAVLTNINYIYNDDQVTETPRSRIAIPNVSHQPVPLHIPSCSVWYGPLLAVAKLATVVAKLDSVA